MKSLFSEKNQLRTLRLIHTYGILSPEIVMQEIHLDKPQAQRLIDFLFIQGYIVRKAIDETVTTPYVCSDGCKGCPFKDGSCSGTNDQQKFQLTEKALKKINA